MNRSLWIVPALALAVSSCSFAGTTTTTDPNADALDQAVLALMRSTSEKEPEIPMNELVNRSFAFLTFVGCPWIETLEDMGIDQITDDVAAELGIELIIDAQGKFIDGTTATREQYVDGFDVFLEEARRHDDPLWQFAVCEQLHQEFPSYVNE